MIGRIKELREYPRYSCNLPVKIITGGDELDGIAMNIGFEGMLIIMDNNKQIDLNTIFNIRFRLPFMIHDTEVRSRVNSNNERTIGVKFIGLKTKDIDGLKRFIDMILDIEGYNEMLAIQSRIAINALLETTLSKLSLDRQLEVALEIILTVSWCSLEYKGSIFSFDRQEQILRMETSINAQDLQILCNKVPIGQCLCGRAAQLKKIVFSNHVHKDHVTVYDDMMPHGHYCVPILDDSELLGVLNIYVPDGHVQDRNEENFLLAAAAIIANLIKFRTSQEPHG
ncbi:hypothetical protein CCP3SC5AM1_70039 [Gammaproteobacteria bacterium]